MSDYYSFIYLDNDIIEDLYPQIFGDIVEAKIVKTKGNSTESKIDGSLVNIINLSRDASGSTMVSEDVKLVSSVARKAQLLINFFKKDNICLHDIIKQNQPLMESVICVGKATFVLRDIYNRKTGRSIFQQYQEGGNMLDENNHPFMREPWRIQNPPFYIEPDDNSIFRLESGDTFGWDRENSIMMNISNYKMKKDIHHLTELVRVNRKFDFYVFGELVMTDGHYCSLSPFAIWQ